MTKKCLSCNRVAVREGRNFCSKCSAVSPTKDLTSNFERYTYERATPSLPDINWLKRKIPQ